MEDFMLRAKKVSLFCLKYCWVIVLALFVIYLLYQLTFSYSTDEVDVVANNELTKEEDVIFVVIDESYIGKKDKGFKSLDENLNSFDFNKKEGKIYFKYKNQLPYYTQDNDGTEEKTYSNTKIIVVFDKGKDSFEHYTEVVSLSTFPYAYYLDNEKIFSVEGINSDGTVFMSFKDKTIKLTPDGSYSDFAFQNFQLTKAKIKNYGIMSKDNFIQLKTDNEIQKEELAKEKEAKKAAEKQKESHEELDLPNIGTIGQ